MEILTGIIPTIMEYTVVPVGRQVGYLFHYKSNLQNLRTQLNNIGAATDRKTQTVNEEEREGKIVHNDVQKWLTEADEMIQEAKKILEDEGHAKTKCSRGECPNLISYHQLSKESAKLAKKIELHEKKFPNVSYNGTLEDILLPSQEYMAFESRASMVKEIMEELKNPDTNMIGVYGLGGVGKTALSKEVFRQASNEKKLFDDVVIILNVNEKLDMEIQKEIAEKLGIEVKEPQSMAVRANCLRRRIKDKKTLVILDAVLSRIDLEAVGLVPVWPCHLLLTSRDREVSFYEMGTQKNFLLDLLSEQESLSLFEKRAGAVIKDDRIQRVAKNLAKKCGGLPLLVVTVASGLRGCSLEEWKDTLRRFKSFEEKGLTEKAFLTLEWSYNRLDSEELKPLFLLCAIMAESNYASLSDLLKYTIGLGLFKNTRTVEEAQNALHSLVKKLKDSCLLLDGYDDRIVRMNGPVRDVAVRIASRDLHVLSRAYTELDESPSKDCSLISLQRCTIPKLPDVPWECPKLNFFYLGSSDYSLEIPSNFFEEMKELKVLDLTQLHFPSLPPSLQSLTNLQTLCLDQCVLGDIALVGQLTNLKILSLFKSEVKELPKEIGQLTRLQLLDLTDCSELVLISPGVISSLTSLEDLRIGSFKQWEGEGSFGGRSNVSVSELKQLRQLTALEIHIPDAKLLPANMFSDTRLERYTILIGDCWLYPRIFGTSSNMLKLKLTTNSQFGQGIKLLLQRCEHLSLDGMEAANIICYILASDSGKQLKNLHVQNNDEVTSLINSSHSFPNLESLSLKNLVNLETVCCRQLIAQPFQKLRSLTLWNLPKLIGLSSKGSTSVVSTEAEEIILENEIGGPTKLFMNGEVLMTNLTRMILHQCDGLRFLFASTKILVQLEHIEISQIMKEVGLSRDQHVLSGAYTELDESSSTDCSQISLQRSTIPKLPDVRPELKLFYWGSDNPLEIRSNFFEEKKELKVLDLKQLHVPSLPPSFQSLTNLQTLCFDQCVLGDIALIGHLTNLKVLSLLNSQVKELPKEIGQLTRLQLLDLTGCSELALISPGVISSLTSLEDLRMGNFKQWEGEGSFGGRSNASVSELKQLRQLTALEIHIPDAKLLPANMFLDTRLERYTILIGDCWLFPDIYGTSSNKLKLKLTTKSQFDQGIKLLLKRCEHLSLDGMESANIISYLLASHSAKQLKNLHVQNNDEVTAVIHSSHDFPILESLSLRNLYVVANS